MKRLHLIGIALINFICLISLAAQPPGENRVTFKAILIIASNDASTSNSRHGRYERKLRKIFRFKSYRYLTEGTGSTNLPGQLTLSLGKAHRVTIQASAVERNKVRARIRWLKDGKALIQTTIVMGRETPAILGGPSFERGNLILVLEAE